MLPEVIPHLIAGDFVIEYDEALDNLKDETASEYGGNGSIYAWFSKEGGVCTRSN
jgi:hypothetical protein